MTKLLNLLKIEIRINYTKIIIAMSITYGLWFLSFLLTLFGKYVSNSFVINYSLSSLLYGSFKVALFINIILTSVSFTEIYEKKWGIFYFTLPVNPVIKVLSKFIYTLFGYFIINILFLLTTTLLMYFVGLILNVSVTLYSFNKFTKVIIDSFFLYLFFHSIYFLFSVIFEKDSFFKTTGIILSVVLLIGIFAGLTLLTVLKIMLNDNLIIDYLNTLKNAKWVKGILYFLYYSLPWVFYLISYFEFKKKEIKG